MRNLRAVFNFAINEEITANYPFRKFKIKTVRTAKRSLEVKELRELFTMEVEEWQRQYRDFFMLSFLLIGTNAKDILDLPANAIVRGRIEFNRAKTKKLYSIRVEPEARAIIERYQGKAHLISALDTRTHCTSNTYVSATMLLNSSAHKVAKGASLWANRCSLTSRPTMPGTHGLPLRRNWIFRKRQSRLHSVTIWATAQPRFI